MTWRPKALTILALIIGLLLLPTPMQIIGTGIPDDIAVRIIHYNNGTLETVQGVFVTITDNNTGEQDTGVTDVNGRYMSYTSGWSTLANGHLLIVNCSYLYQPYNNSTILVNLGNTITAIDINVTDNTPPAAPAVETPSSLFSTGPYQIYVNGTSEPFANVTLEAEGVPVDNSTAAVDGSYSFLVTLTGNTNLTVRADDILGNSGTSGQWMTILPVGAGGGSLYSGDGNMSLEIPPGAMAGEGLITLSGDSTENPYDNSLPVYDFGPEGHVFSSPVTLTFQYTAGDFPAELEERLKVFYDNGTSGWTEIASTADPLINTITAELTHFTSFTLGPALVETYQAGPSWTDVGARIPILRVNISDNGGGGDTLNSLNITANNTDNTRVDGASLWLDDGNQAFHPDFDTMLVGTTAFAAGTIEFTGLAEPLAASGFLDLFVVYNVSDTALDGDRLDCWINTSDLWLQTQGSNDAPMDPAGNTSVNGTSLPVPYAVYGYTKDTAGTAVGPITVNITNNNTGESIELLSAVDGRYYYDISQMPSGYTEGDVLWFYTNNTTPNYGGYETMVMDTHGEMVNITLELGPVVSNPNPQDGWIVNEEYRMVNLTIDDTAGSYDVDPASIVININGTNYTVDGTILLYTGTQLSFNTTAAGEKWNESTLVSVTLWAANDTIGNPYQNVFPYAYQFMYSSSALNAPDILVQKSGDDLNITWDVVDNAVWYHVFNSTEVNGTGFNFSSPVLNTTNTYYLDAGKYLDNTNHSYVVRALNYAGTSNKSNIGWKLCYQLIKNGAVSGGDLNYLAVPYNINISGIIGTGGMAGPHTNDAAALAYDISDVSVVARWDNNIGAWESLTYIEGLTMALGTNFPLENGTGYLVGATDPVLYKMVGSYNSSTQINLKKNGAVSGGDLNYISLPYHFNITEMISTGGMAGMHYNDAAALAASIGDCSVVARWDNSIGAWESLTYIQGLNMALGSNFQLKPGESYLIGATNPATWQCPVVEL